MQSVLGYVASALILAFGVAAICYFGDLRRSYQRIRGRGSVVCSPFGDIQYLEGGSGPVVLVIHGSGGGYDQGELIAQAVLGDTFYWIAPSRFGYLQSSLPEHATWDDQAHAYAFLLDHLGYRTAAVVAMSHGGPSALLFAALHPERVSSLICLSCGVVASQKEDQIKANRKGNMLKVIFQFDLVYWLVSKLFKRQFMALIGADKAIITRLTNEQRKMVGRFIDFMNPVSPRSSGVAFDNETALPGDRIASIVAPTLIVHAKDDRLQLYHNAVFAASKIPSARLASFERGGHILSLVEQAEIRKMVQEHVRLHENPKAV